MRQRESREVFEAYLASETRWLGDATDSFDSEFERIVRDCLPRGFRRVYELPDDHPFWQDPRHLNTQTTSMKVREYHEWALGHQGDDDARWFLIAWVWTHCAMAAYHVPLFLPLIQRDRRNLRWLINAARQVYHGSGAPATEILRSALNEAGKSIPDLHASIKLLAEDGETSVCEAAEAALRVLSGGSLPEESGGAS